MKYFLTPIQMLDFRNDPSSFHETKNKEVNHNVLFWVRGPFWTKFSNLGYEVHNNSISLQLVKIGKAVEAGQSSKEKVLGLTTPIWTLPTSIPKGTDSHCFMSKCSLKCVCVQLFPI